jgi:hypothetical protein
LEDELAGVQDAASSQVAQSEAADAKARAEREAQKEQDKMGVAGSIIGLGASFLSSESAKDDHGPEKGFLSKLKKVRVNRWNYKGEDETHVGPFAEEFNREFGTDTSDPSRISIIDAIGVTLGAVKELSEQVNGR